MSLIISNTAIDKTLTFGTRASLVSNLIKRTAATGTSLYPADNVSSLDFTMAPNTVFPLEGNMLAVAVVTSQPLTVVIDSSVTYQVNSLLITDTVTQSVIISSGSAGAKVNIFYATN